MLPPIRRSHPSPSSVSGAWLWLSSRLSSLVSSSSPLLLCVGLIAALFLFVTAATSLPSLLSSGGGFARREAEVNGGRGGVGAVAAALRGGVRSAPQAILQWEKPSAVEEAEGGGGAGAAPAVAPAGGAPLAAAPTAASQAQPPGPPPPPPPPPPPLVVKPHHESVELDSGGLWASHAEAIKAAFVHAYSHYERKCFGQDEYRPVPAHHTAPHSHHITLHHSTRATSPPHPPLLAALTPCNAPSSTFSPIPLCLRPQLSGQCYNWIGAGLTIIGQRI